MEEYEEKAFRAYYIRNPDGAHPSRMTDSFIEKGKFYVVLQNVNGPLAIYQIYDDGRIRYVKDRHIWKVAEEM